MIPYMHPNGGGPPVVVDRVCHELNELGVESDILTTDLYAEHDDSWMSVWKSHSRISAQSVDKQTPYAKSSALYSELSKRVSSYNLVNLHTLWSHSSRAVNQVCSRQKVPYVVMPHGMLDPNSLQRKRLKKQLYGSLFEYPMLRSSAGLLCTHTEEERLARQSLHGLPPAFITPLGADNPPDDRDVLRQEFHKKHPELSQRPVVVFLSRLHEKKGLDMLIPAMKVVQQSIPEVLLLLVGSGEPSYEQSLTSLVAATGLEQNIRMIGHLSGREKWQAMAAGDVFALSSYQENFALVVVDAMVLGLPVVLSNRVNIWSDVVQSGAGLECKMTPDDIAAQLLSLLSSPQKCLTMGEQGRNLVETEFTWRRCAERTRDAYRQLMNR